MKTSLLEYVRDLAKEAESDRNHYSHIKDLDEPRPRMSPKPDTSGMMKSHGATEFDLYLQDEASDVMIDKYGLQKGYAAWAYTLDQNGGVMFAASAQIANEKSKMYSDLGLFPKDYFERSYLDLWREWSTKLHGKKHKPVVAKDPVPVTEPAKTVTQTPVLTNKSAAPKEDKFSKLIQTIKPTPKDVMRVSDIIYKAGRDRSKEIQLATNMADKTKDLNKLIGRGRAAEDENYHEIAKIFFDKARSMVAESIIKKLEESTGKKVILSEGPNDFSEYISENEEPEIISEAKEIPSELPGLILDYVNKKHGSRAVEIAREIGYDDWRLVAAAIKQLASENKVSIYSNPSTGLFVFPPGMAKANVVSKMKEQPKAKVTKPVTAATDSSVSGNPRPSVAGPTSKQVNSPTKQERLDFAKQVEKYMMKYRPFGTKFLQEPEVETIGDFIYVGMLFQYPGKWSGKGETAKWLDEDKFLADLHKFIKESSFADRIVIDHEVMEDGYVFYQLKIK